MSKSQQEFLNDFIDEIDAADVGITDFSEGSNVDVLAGASSLGADEIVKNTQDEVRKTFFSFAGGPDETGGPDDLEFLAVDHFGEDFRRPGAKKAPGIVKFSRANTDKGDVLIDIGTIIKTQKTSAGNAVSFRVISAVTMTGLEINASVEALIAGPTGNVNAGTITVVETSLSDSSIVVTNEESFVGGKNAENDAEYRLTIIRLLKALIGATVSAIEQKAKTVPGVVYAKGIEFLQHVIEWDIINEVTVGSPFPIPRAKLYIGDANGNSSSLLISLVREAIRNVRAAGVEVKVIGTTPVTINWNAEVVLNPMGPNFSVLETDLTLIKDVMRKYLEDRPTGQNFVRELARAYVMAKFGPSGTNDITSFNTLAPAADVAIAENQKALPGTMGINVN